MTPSQSAIQKAVEVLGGRRELCAASGISEQAVSFWLAGSRQISAEYAIRVEEATGGRVTRSELRPDLFARTAA
jgi:DNA-binding transcriptional regulator YdaS (Cro superfamily)